VAIEAIRVLSEDLSPIRRTRLHLCEDGASAALGKALRECVSKLRKCLEQFSENASSTQIESRNEDWVVKTRVSFDDDNAESLVTAQRDQYCLLHPSQRNIRLLHESLCALANILDPIQDSSSYNLGSSHGPVSGSKELLINGCLQTVESGGLESLLWISSLPLKPRLDYGFSTIDLLQESCRSLGSMSPLLLSKEFAKRGYSRWADYVLLVFHRLLEQLTVFDEQDKVVDTTELHVSVLQGVGALAKSAPLKVRIVDRFLPYLIQAKTIRDRSDVSNAATQAFQSLEFAEDEVSMQVSGSNASLYADWFCLQRSLLIQAMAREEIRRIVVQTWENAFSDVQSDKITQLMRRTSDKYRDEDTTAILFENFADDSLSDDNTADIMCQYRDTYQGGEPHVVLDPSTYRRITAVDDNSNKSGDEENEGLLYTQMYPLNNSANETAWILDHLRFLDCGQDENRGLVCLPPHVAKFLAYCFPSRLLRDHVLPVKSLNPDASFNFRALMMPQRRYFSFRREGQLLSRLWDKEDSCPNPSDFHWTLGFTNSSYAGEFAESLVQVLYLCPMICGLSFVQNEEFKSKKDPDDDGKDNNASDGSSLLANLAGSLPRWISHLTFEGLLNDRDLRTLVKILDTMGKLSAGKENVPHPGPPAGRHNDHAASQVQGSFWFVAVRRSLDVSPAVWQSFFGLLGKVSTKPGRPLRRPLSTLKSLDLSGNRLGDDLCAKLLGLIHDKDSDCCLEQLDLSGNNIKDGTNIVKVLTGYVQYHRADLLGGGRKVWTAPLKTLRLSSNELYRGKAWFEIFLMLKNNALALKVLDLADNSISLEEDESEILGSSLLSNTFMCQLDLSRNKFSAASIDKLLGQLNKATTDLGLAFLDFSGNEPSLSEYQLRDLRTFYRASRAVALRRYLLEKELEKDDRDYDQIYEYNGMPAERTMDDSYQTLGSLGGSLGQDDSMKSFASPTGENMITVLFSAPLVFEDTKRVLRPFAKLDFEMERELMWQCLKEASRDIDLRFDTATIPRLQASMAQRCSCLHYSGHGHEEFLPFEDGKGFPHWVKVDEIKKLIAGRSGVPFRFVFVSACYSGKAGENFAKAGVPHVVCCRQQYELKDAAALAFTRQFYLALAVGNTVKESFDQGCSAVRASPNLRDAEKEMEKFMLLPKDGNHDVPIFNAKPVVEWPRVMKSKFSRTKRGASMRASVVGARGSELSVRNMMQEAPCPSPPHFFFGREVDMYHVLTHVLEKRLVSVWGEAGVGRSSLVYALCHYINERASTVTQIDRIYYVKTKQGKKKNRVRAVIQKLLKRLVEAGKTSPLDTEGEPDMETLFDAICGSLTTEKALIVFDRTEFLSDSDEGNEFPMLLSNLFRETRNVRVLLTARAPLGIASIGGQVEQHHELGPLTFADTVRLFACLCPYITPAQRRQLEAQLVDKKGEAELLPADPGLSEETKKIFALLGQGIPSKIEESASTISKDDVLDMLRGTRAS
jgi:Leucine Rich repeat